jgi:protein TonB
MATLVEVPPPPARPSPPSPPPPPPARTLGFQLLESARGGGSYGLTFTTSLAIHLVLIAALVIVPLLLVDPLVPTSTSIRTFFAEPPSIAPPPPPPPPPAPGVRAMQKPAVVPTPPPKDDVFRAPVVIPSEVIPEPDLGSDLGVEGGVPGGVEGGVPGGVLGGIVGGELSALPAPTRPPVRVGGNIKEPKKLLYVPPVYPLLARNAHIEGVVILEAEVDEHGVVKQVRVLRSAPLLDAAAIESVRQWRYRPLLLNGEPSPFILSVTVKFNLSTPIRE